jgi:transcriptional regulator with GAF, ATPase, and Fis domain
VPRVIQDGEFERLGSSRTRKVDVRIIAATNRDLEEEVRLGRFRQDLFYRLNVYSLSLPPLRKRVEDIPFLVTAFVQKYSKKLGRQIATIPQKTLDALQQYSWPGNVREFENIIERRSLSPKAGNCIWNCLGCQVQGLRLIKPLKSWSGPILFVFLKKRAGRLRATGAQPAFWTSTPARFAPACVNSALNDPED